MLKFDEFIYDLSKNPEIKYNSLSDTEDNKAVAYSSMGRFGKTFAPAENVLSVVKDYFVMKKQETNPILTDKNNNIQFINFRNGLYIDIDYYMKDIKNKEQFNRKIGRLFLNGFLSQLDDENTVYYFMFVPNEFTENEGKYKGGCHIMCICNKLFTKDEQMELYNAIIRYCVDNYENNKIDITNIISESVDPKVIFQNIFDKQPIQSGLLLCPFGQKSETSRQYKLYKDNYEGQNWFVLETEQNEQKNISQSLTEQEITRKAETEIKIHTKSDDEEEEDEEILNQETVATNVKILEPKILLSKPSLLLYNFVNSLQYLSSNHEFWLWISRGDLFHEKYYKDILVPYIKILTLFNICEAEDEEEFNRLKNRENLSRTWKDALEDITNLAINQMVNICLNTRESVADKNNRYSFIEQKKNINAFYSYTTFKENLFGSYFNSNGDEQVINSPFTIYYLMKEYKFNFMNKDYIKCYGEVMKKHKLLFKRFNNISIQTIKEFSNFVTDIKDGISDEIRPFNRTKSYFNQECYRESKPNDTFREKLTFYDVEPDFDITNGSRSKVINSDSTYYNTIKSWIEIILTFRFYENNFQLQSAITETLGAFVKRYISIISVSSSANKKGNDSITLIYNIRQTKDMESYPYNQWINDQNKAMINQWITKLYNSYIKQCLYTSSSIDGMRAIITPLVESKIITSIYALNRIAPLPHADKDITEMVNNIIKVHPTESSKIPIYIPIETSPIFPLRNGWLKFRTGIDDVDKGLFGENEYIHFEENNMESYTTSTTNVIWVGDCDDYKRYISTHKDQEEAYNMVSKMISEIYPAVENENGEKTTEERDYNMKLFASVLYGCGTKDILHILFGTGSDGKTTIINALFGMLDAEGFTSNVGTIEDGRYIQFNSTQGLASTMKAETLLLTNNNIGGHDEGGRACIAHMRLVNVQEPDQSQHGGRLNGATIKELTSCSAIASRRIYGAAESVQANALITFQTNFYPGTDDNTSGFRRRLSVYKHRTKFITQTDSKDEEDNENYAFHYVANPSLNDYIIRNVWYKQAMFYYLLPYAIDNLRNGDVSLQRIKKPHTVEEEVDKVLSNTTGASVWLTTHIIRCEKEALLESDPKHFRIINVQSLLDCMVNNNKNKSEKMWENRKVKEEKDMLLNTIQNQFERNIFKLKNKFYTGTKTKKLIKDNKLIEFVKVSNIDNDMDCLRPKKTEAEYKNEFLDRKAVNDIKAGYLTSYKDLFLYGFYYKEDKEEELE